LRKIEDAAAGDYSCEDFARIATKPRLAMCIHFLRRWKKSSHSNRYQSRISRSTIKRRAIL